MKLTERFHFTWSKKKLGHFFLLFAISVVFFLLWHISNLLTVFSPLSWDEERFFWCWAFFWLYSFYLPSQRNIRHNHFQRSYHDTCKPKQKPRWFCPWISFTLETKHLFMRISCTIDSHQIFDTNRCVIIHGMDAEWNMRERERI